MNRELVSVIIPTYNYAHFITYAIESVLNQSYPVENIEIIIVDDGSTDNTREVVAPYLGSTTRYYFQQNKGKANATKAAIFHSNGKYIFNLDADDFFLETKIEEVVRKFEADESIVHIGTPAKIFYEDKKEWGQEVIPGDISGKVIAGTDLLNLFYKKNILFGGGSTYAARGAALRRIIIPDAVDMYIDEFLILAVLPYGNSYFFEQPLSVWRVHQNNFSVGVSTPDAKIKKGKRLLASSDAVLSYLERNHFQKQIISIYSLKNEIRKISYLENIGKKSLGDITRYAGNIFLKIRPGWKIIFKYNALSRLAPLFLLALKKNLFKPGGK